MSDRQSEKCQTDCQTNVRKTDARAPPEGFTRGEPGIYVGRSGRCQTIRQMLGATGVQSPHLARSVKAHLRIP